LSLGNSAPASRGPSIDRDRLDQSFPVSAGVLFGLGLGGFFDGIVMHQVLQWHHMLTAAGYPATSVENLEVNTLWDGVFHATTYAFVVLGLVVLWRASRRTHIRWSSKLLAGSMLIGFGIFNLVEGIVDHHLLGIHHVNETVPREEWNLLGRGLPGLGCCHAVRRLVPSRGGPARDPEPGNTAPRPRVAAIMSLRQKVS
jgi:uncharacterized membrane protein